MNPARRLWPALLALLVATAAAKLAYVFCCTHYRDYVFGDSAHYFGRALAFFNGEKPWHLDWDVFPMGGPVLLALYWAMLDGAGLHGHFVESAMVLNVLASTGCTALVFHLAWRLTGRLRLSLVVAGVYGFYFPLWYLNAFVLSEPGASVLFLVALGALAESWRRPQPLRWLAVSGLFWALACHCRGSLLPWLPWLLLVWLAHPLPGLRRRIAMPVWLAAAALVFAAAAGALHAASDGAAHKSTGNNGGFNFFLQQCHFNGIVSAQNHFTWDFYPAGFTHQKQLGTYFTDVPLSDQGFYYREALRCIERQPGSVIRLVAFIPTLFYSQFFPELFDAAGYRTVVPWFRHLNVLLVLLTPLGYLALRRRNPPLADLLLGTGAVLWLTAAWFNADHRHLYGFTFVYCLFGVAGAWRWWQAGWRLKLGYAAAAAAFTALAVWLFAVHGPWALYDDKPVRIRPWQVNLPVPDGTPVFSLDALRFWNTVTIVLDGPQHPAELRLSLDAQGIYDLTFQRQGQTAGKVRLALNRADDGSEPKGLIRRALKLPAGLRERGFDTLVVTPVSGNGLYAMAGLELRDDPRD